ncbi:MAG: LysM repeat protein [Gammaproteobacteria bacterium]|jgi:LysM repeat protein
MEQSEIPITVEKHSRPVLALEIEDVGNLDSVLRGYYLSQIKSLEKRKDRKQARRLLENHLVLPKSRQRTSKDAGYIKEILDIDYSLLEKLEDSRLIRRIHKTGANPIYEVSHDTLVEPILAERKDREAIARFIKRTWRYFAALLLLWFLFGMLFENTFEVIPKLSQGSKSTAAPKSIAIVMEEQVFHIGENLSAVVLPLPPIVIDQELKPADSIFIKLPLAPIRIAGLGSNGAMGADTISIKLAGPIEIPVDGKENSLSYQSFSDVVVPFAFAYDGSGNPVGNKTFAKLSGFLKMTPKGIDVDSIREFNRRSEPIEMKLGETEVQSGKSTQSVPLNFDMQLTDFFEDENDKNSIRTIFGDRPVKLSYIVQVRPSSFTASPPKIEYEYPSVQGIEVQYSNGTSKFIPGDTTSVTNITEQLHIVAVGETLFSIAKKYGIMDESGNTSTKEIKKLNGLRDDKLSIGQAIRIPVY